MRIVRLLRAGALACEALGSQQKAAASLVEAAASVSLPRSFASLSHLPRQEAAAAGFGLSQVAQRSISSSSFAGTEALTNVAVDGDVASLLKQIDGVVSNESSTAKDIADAAVALAYVQAKGARRVWGKVFERAAALKDSFDAASLSAFAWASTTAGVQHFRTVFELAGPAASLLKSMSPAQLSLVVEALGKAGSADAELFSKIGDQVVADLAKFKGAELARTLWGFAAAGQEDARLAKAAGKALADKASELSAREASQAVWALARMRRADKPVLDALVRAATGKLGAGESAVDAAALAWSLGFLGYPADTATKGALTAALKAGAADLTAAHAVDAAWGLALSGAGDAATVQALLSNAAAAVEAAPDSLDPYQLGALYTAAVLVPEAKVSDKVKTYAGKMYSLSADHARAHRSASAGEFRAQVAEALAVALGARYRPEIKKAVDSYHKTTADGFSIDIAAEVDKGVSVAVEPLGPFYLTSAGTPLGPALGRARVLEAKGFKVVTVPLFEWAPLGTTKARASYLLKAISKAAPAASRKVETLIGDLAKPFDAYAE